MSFIWLLPVMGGSYASNLKGAWALRNHPNMLFIYYEDLKKNIQGELQKINDFIGTNLTKEQLKNVSFVFSEIF